MKNVLNYQTSEFDCGPVALLNGVRYLFDREEINPEIVKFIMLYCMDTFNESGELCRRGTSAAAVQYMVSWMNHFAEMRNFPISCEYLQGEQVTVVPGSPVYTALENGAAVMVRLILECPHYVLLTGLTENGRVLLFDPYYEEEDDPDLDEEYKTDEICFITDRPKSANRSVALDRLNRTGEDYYEMGGFDLREAVIMRRTSMEAPVLKPVVS